MRHHPQTFDHNALQQTTKMPLTSLQTFERMLADRRATNSTAAAATHGDAEADPWTKMIEAQVGSRVDQKPLLVLALALPASTISVKVESYHSRRIFTNRKGMSQACNELRCFDHFC